PEHSILEVETLGFCGALITASGVRGCTPDSGWKIRSVERKRVRVRRAGIDLLARRSQCVSGSRLAPGAAVELKRPRIAERLSPGFVFFFSRAAWQAASAPVARFYWNISAMGAPRFVRAAIATLDRDGVPYCLKVANHPSRFNRR